MDKRYWLDLAPRPVLEATGSTAGAPLDKLFEEATPRGSHTDAFQFAAELIQVRSGAKTALCVPGQWARRA